TLAEQVGCAPVTISKIEREERRPSPQMADLLAKYLSIPDSDREKFMRMARGEFVASLPAIVMPASPAPSPHMPAHNPLPIQATPFVGREEELAELAALYANPACRLLTLVGPGGMGKTRLAIEAARQVNVAHGVRFVSLASLTSAGGFVSTMADSLGLILQTAGDPKQQLLSYLAHQELLLVLDNFEHLLPGDTGPDKPGPQSSTALVAELLEATPQLKILVTSRERLNLQAEWVFQVEGLTVPADHQAESVDMFSAPQLFWQQARRVNRNFGRHHQEWPAIGRICRLVEGMPLGLELAAAWVRVLSCQEIAQEIENNLEFLTTWLRDQPVRHRSMVAVFDQSWQHLTAEEQRVFRNLTVFRGSFSREAAAEVAGASLPLLLALADKSLVRRTVAGRYELHELLRQYGREKLAEAGEREAAQNRHLAFCLNLAEEAEPHLVSSDQAAWLDRLKMEYDNLRAALEWSRMAGDQAELGLRLAGSLHDFWFVGYVHEGREYLSAALARPETLGRTAARAKALWAAGELAYIQDDHQAARPLFEESLAIYRELGPAGRRGLAYVLTNIGHYADDYAAAFSLMHEALEIMQALEDVKGIATVWRQLGRYALRVGDYEQAVHCLEEAVPLLRQAGDKLDTALALSSLGEAALRRGDYERAITIVEESLTLCRELDDQWGIAASYGNFAWIALRQDELKQAVTLLMESLTLRYEIRERGGCAWCLEKLAEIALTVGQREAASRRAEAFQRAVRLFGAAEALREPLGSVIDLADQPEYKRQVAMLQAQLDERAFTTAWAEGRAMRLEQAIQEALAVGAFLEEALPYTGVVTG
ncbi:MAG: tetratricopeptide repeat protein, partial [Anaerolineae bacterium]|nr:tetratricopeptide repeat protein [Anaerolineae bacterium]